MKQVIVGLGVLVVFVAYSLGVRHEQSAAVISAAPAAQPAGSAPTSSGINTPSNPQPAPTSAHGYKNGTFSGSAEDAFYGNVQVSATISGGKLTDVEFLQYPDTHSTSVMINQQAMPMLKQEAIQKQAARVDIISGATFTSQAFVQSLTNALDQARPL
jgi:uncharacterized protein with FMN-binding domain